MGLGKERPRAAAALLTKANFEPPFFRIELCHSQTGPIDSYTVTYRAVLQYLCAVGYRELVRRRRVDVTDPSYVLEVRVAGAVGARWEEMDRPGVSRETHILVVVSPALTSTSPVNMVADGPPPPSSSSSSRGLLCPRGNEGQEYKGRVCAFVPRSAGFGVRHRRSVTSIGAGFCSLFGRGSCTSVTGSNAVKEHISHIVEHYPVPHSALPFSE